MDDIPTPGQSVREVKKILDSLPKPPTPLQFKEAEMERDAALVAAERNAEKVEHLRTELKRAVEKASREKKKLAGRLQAESLSWQVRAEDSEAELEDLQEKIRKDAPFLRVVQAHANKEGPTKGCSCPACQALQSVAALKQEVAEAKRKYRETKEILNTFQGPPSRKRRKGKR